MLNKFFQVFFFQVFILNFSVAQDGREILIRSLEKIEEIKSCNFIIYNKSKITGMRDTSYRTGKCAFVIAANDSITGKHFRIEDFHGITEIYNASEYIKMSTYDSSAYIWNAAEYNFYVNSLKSNPVAYAPLFNRKNMFTQLAADTEALISLAADTLINESLCYHVKSISRKQDARKKTEVGIETHLFIYKNNLLPAGHIRQLHSNFNKALDNYESSFLEDLEVNRVINPGVFELSSIPVQYTLKQQASVTTKSYVGSAGQIPDLQTNFVADYTFKQLKGKNMLVVIIDGVNCVPCDRAMNMIDEIYQKFKKKKIQFLIVSDKGCYIKSEPDSLNITEKNYPIAKKIIEANRINTFPSLYLITKNGVQPYKREGFNEQMSTEINKAIRDVLEN